MMPLGLSPEKLQVVDGLADGIAERPDELADCQLWNACTATSYIECTLRYHRYACCCSVYTLFIVYL